MAIVIEANYSKKIGLPSYSSHQFMVTQRTELADLNQVGAESTRLYDLLQRSVDQEMQKIGFLPDQPHSNGNGNGHQTNGHSHNGHAVNGNGNGSHSSDVWACSEKQRGLILQVVEDNRLDKKEIESLSLERFNTPVKALNKLQASGLIDELLGKYGGKRKGNGSNGSNGYRRAPSRQVGR